MAEVFNPYATTTHAFKKNIRKCSVNGVEFRVIEKVRNNILTTKKWQFRALFEV